MLLQMITIEITNTLGSRNGNQYEMKIYMKTISWTILKSSETLVAVNMNLRQVLESHRF